jgi:hypothetical protein
MTVHVNVSSAESEEAKKDFQHLDHGIINLSWKSKDIAHVKTCYHTTHTPWMAANEDTLQLNKELNIEI